MIFAYEQHEMISEEMIRKVSAKIPLNLYTQHR